MRVEAIREAEGNPMSVEIVLTLSRAEQLENYVGWHDDCQLVKGHDVEDLLDEAARRLNESDYGADWSRAMTLKDLAAEIRGEKADTARFEAAHKPKGAKA